jgi:mannose-6-phosphate isomerase-like protein (cupin superfamily)
MLGLNLTQLATKIGVTEGYLSKLENNRSQASMATLHRLTRALNTNMSALFSTSPSGDDGVLVVRANERPRLVTGRGRAKERITLERLIPSGPGHLMQINVHVVPVGGGSLEAITHDGQEFGYVLAGAFELTVNSRSVELAPGDAFYFASVRKHSYRNVGNVEARILWVNTPPTF